MDVVISAISGVHIRNHIIDLQLNFINAIKEAGNINGKGPPPRRWHTQGVFVDEDDVATYIIKTINDPRTLNMTLYLKPPDNIFSQGDGRNTNCFTLFARTRPVKTRALTALNKKMMPMKKLVLYYQKRKDLMTTAGDALKTNITTLSPLVLPTSEQLLLFATLVAKKFLKTKVKVYILDFKLTFELFYIHAGGRTILDELKKNLQLSLWHKLAYTEANERVKKGDRVWQIAFGSGFKCNRAI
ncbi:hypothetical protein HN873_006749 [Arachis hypogaea]